MNKSNATDKIHANSPNAKKYMMYTVVFVMIAVVLLGFLTEWTFSGLNPIEGKRCHPQDDEKSPHSDVYVYDKNEDCENIISCDKNWQPNSGGTKCERRECFPQPSEYIEGGKFTFDINGKCSLEKCESDSMLVDGKCVSKVCNPISEYNVEHAKKYMLDETGSCTLVSKCKEGWQPSGNQKSCKLTTKCDDDARE
jgi:hypothetical protein